MTDFKLFTVSSGEEEATRQVGEALWGVRHVGEALLLLCGVTIHVGEAAMCCGLWGVAAAVVAVEGKQTGFSFSDVE